MEKLFTLLELQRRAQEAPTRQALAHIAVNETHKLVPYGQAIFWSHKNGSIRLEKVSGNAVLDDKSPYAHNLQERIVSAIKQETRPAYTLQDNAKHIAIIPFRTLADGLLGGLWLERDNKFPEPELHLLEELAVTYANSLALLSLRDSKTVISLAKSGGKYKKHFIVAGILLAFFPVHLSVTAPAEIVARDSDIVTVPYDGMIETIHVRPGESVTKGQLLATMESSALSAQMDMAQQELKVSQSSVARLSRESLAAPDRKGDLIAAEAEIRNKKIQYDYAQDMKSRSEIRASRDGVAVFSDAHMLQGQPVTLGTRIMMVADEKSYDLLIRIPSDSMVPIDKEAPVTFFLNVSPLHGYDAEIKSIGYQASPDPDGLLTYKVQAVPEQGSDLRIGWKGTARIKGQWTVLAYSILRRPLIAVRRVTGW